MTIRPACALVTAAVLLMLTSSTTSGALAQDAPSVSATLLFQTRFTTPDRPELKIAVAVTNTGASPVEDLALAISFGPAVISRLSYEQALATGPSSVMATEVVPLDRTIDVGSARVLSAGVDVTAVPGIALEDSRVYPIEIAVRAGGVTVAEIRSAEIHVVREPEAPVRFTWWLSFTAAPAFDADGTFRNPALAASLAQGGSLAARAEALARVAARAATVDAVIQPSLLLDAADMADGYVEPGGTQVPPGSGGAAAAARFLAQLRAAAAAPTIRIVPLPMYAPTSPSLLAADLGPERREQERIGAQVIRDTLGVEPAVTAVRPVDGALDSKTLDRYAAQGRDVLLADAETVARPPQENGFAPDPTATVAGADGQPVTLVLPDPSTQSLMASPDLLADPVRAAQAVLGEIAVIWKEAPSPDPPVVRGLAVALPDTLPPPVWAPLMDRLATAPFLQRVHGPTLVADVSPAGAAATLTSPDSRTFSEPYVDRLRALGLDVEAYASMLTEDTVEPDRLRLDLLQAQSAEYLGLEALGAPWMDHAAAITGAAFESTTPDVPQAFTLTSAEGTLPLRMGDPGGTPLSVTVRLESSRFEFPQGNEQKVTLVEPNQVVEFEVVAKAAGRNPIRLVVLTPTGRPISEQTIVVRTTTVNTIALAITVAAAAGLLLLYARRWTRRRTRT